MNSHMGLHCKIHDGMNGSDGRSGKNVLNCNARESENGGNFHDGRNMVLNENYDHMIRHMGSHMGGSIHVILHNVWMWLKKKMMISFHSVFL